jgi:deazaflavin-dependent oxidoreductase (nitroreductase family)
LRCVACSGKARPQSVRAIREGDQVFLVCMMGHRASWLKNIRACPQVTIRLGNDILRGTARETVDLAERHRAAEVYVGTIDSSDYFDYVVYCWSIPTRRRVERAHRRWFDEWVPVVIELERTQ